MSKRIQRVPISVVMATYNGARFLHEQVNSILNSMGKQDELVITDDGSTDGTFEILQKYAAADLRIRLLPRSKHTLGVKQNFARGIAASKNEIIFLADQDDVWMRDKIKKVVEVFEQDPSTTMVMHDSKVVDEKLKEIEPSFIKMKGVRTGVKENILKNSYMGCSLAFRRSLLDKILPIPDDIEMHDQWIGIMSDTYGKTVLLEEPLIKYRRHGENASSMKHYGVMRMVKNRLALLKNYNMRKEAVKKESKNIVDKSLIADIVLVLLYGALDIFVYYCISNTVSGFMTMALGVILAFRYKFKFGYFTNSLGIFGLAWFSTLGLACLRLHPDQTVWKFGSWVAFICAYTAFLAGYSINLKLKQKHKAKSASKLTRAFKFFNKSDESISRKTFLSLILGFSTVVLAAFLIEFTIRGFVPMFSDDMAAYVTFSVTGLHYFTVSSALLLPLVVVYLCCYKKGVKLRELNKNITVPESLTLIFATILSLVMPFLIVSRQLYLATIIIAAFSYIFINRRKELVAIILAGVMLLAGWVAIGNLRNQDATYLAEALNISKNEGSNKGDDDDNAIKGTRTYMYFACGYDNFNLNLGNTKSPKRFGTNSFFPVFGLSGLKFIFPEIIGNDVDLIAPTFNTFPAIMYPYLDFGYGFIFIYIALLGFIVHLFAEKSSKKRFGPVIIRSIVKYALLFMFFDNMFANATIWFYVIILVFIENIILRRRVLPMKGDFVDA